MVMTKGMAVIANKNSRRFMILLHSSATVKTGKVSPISLHAILSLFSGGVKRSGEFTMLQDQQLTLSDRDEAH